MIKPVDIRELEENQSFYYSLSLPTLLEGSPLKKGSSTVMVDLREIKLLIETLKNHLKRTNTDNSAFARSDFDFFHAGDDKLGEIKSSSELIKTDKFFTKDDLCGRSMCTTSRFFNGCIRITPKDK